MLKNENLGHASMNSAHFLLRQVDPRLLKLLHSDGKSLPVNFQQDHFDDSVLLFSCSLLLFRAGGRSATRRHTTSYLLLIYKDEFNRMTMVAIMRYHQLLRFFYQNPIYGWVFPAFSYHCAKTSKVSLVCYLHTNMNPL